jgi:1,4-alpha-glucan branching enzyme
VIKSRRAKGKADVTFTVDPQAGAQTAVVCGEWNDWSADADVMHYGADGGFSVTVSLDAGRAYRFRYLLDGHRWDNDWSADAYQANGFGGDDSVVDLTALTQAVPAATKKAAARKTPEARKQATPKKVSAPKASSAREAPKKASAAKDEKAAPDQAAPPAKPARKKAK